jgi:hypothetical protein
MKRFTAYFDYLDYKGFIFNNDNDVSPIHVRHENLRKPSSTRFRPAN